MWRFQHTAISSHFLILWGLALYFESRRGRGRVVEMWLLAVLALLVNSYLFAMVIGLQATTLLSLASARRLGKRDLYVAMGGATFVVAIAIVLGYGIMFTNPSSMQAMGFGLFSSNLVSLFVPRSLGVVRDATGGQYEGEAYVGMGALLALSVALVMRPGNVARHVRNHKWLVGFLAVCLAYAASNRVYVGRTLILSYDVPASVESLASFYRANGRFIWPAAYSLVVLPLACVFRWCQPTVAVTIAAVAVSVQLLEFGPHMRHFRTITGRAAADVVDVPQMEAWVKAHEGLWQYPSYSCGGLSGPQAQWGGVEANRELQLQMTAARAGVPTNSVYTSRQLKNCVRELEWGAHPRFEEGVLYVLSWRTVVETPALASLVASGPCTGLSWGVVCSTRFRAPVARADTAR